MSDGVTEPLSDGAAERRQRGAEDLVSQEAAESGGFSGGGDDDVVSQEAAAATMCTVSQEPSDVCVCATMWFLHGLTLLTREED